MLQCAYLQTGWWKKHLAHARGENKAAPYHISALYVVDLDVLRAPHYEKEMNRELIGKAPLQFEDLGKPHNGTLSTVTPADLLRQAYHMMTADPQSLSNLDQDLPNHLQARLPIHSLPQEWLWCESWCSDASKKAAKTIDLCNNPRHKEPKLDMAKRVIAGPLFQESWVELGEEARACCD